MFSATLPINVQQTAKSYLKPDYISVTVGKVGGACIDVTQTFVEVNKFSKKNALVALLNDTSKHTFLISPYLKFLLFCYI